MARPFFMIPFFWLLALIAVEAGAQDDDTELITSDRFVVVVHADNPASVVDRRTLSKMFLKKVKRWPDSKEPVMIIDLEAASPVREAFTRSIHKKSVSAIESYWQRMIFSGRDVPPDELPSDAEVVAQVGADIGGVGYVSPDTDLGSGVKILSVSEK